MKNKDGYNGMDVTVHLWECSFFYASHETQLRISQILSVMQKAAS